MPLQSAQCRHLKKARNARNTLKRSPFQTIQNNEQRPIEAILTTINCLNISELNELLKQIYILKDSKDEMTGIQRKKDEVIRRIHALSDEEVLNVHHLLKTMVYPKGIHIGKILSPYLQKKAYEFIKTGLYRQESSAIAIQNKKKSLEKENKKLKNAAIRSNTQIRSLTQKVAKAELSRAKQTSKIRAAIQNAKKITPNKFNKTVKQMFNTNKKEYNPQFVKMASEISNKGHNSINSTVESTKAIYEFLTGEAPTKWISPSTLARWNKEIAQINLEENRPENTTLQFHGYGIMADESTRGEKKILIICAAHWNQEKNKPLVTVIKMKDIIHCNGKNVAEVVLNACNENQLNPRSCYFWLTDNTAYMSAEKNGAITHFNIMAAANSFRIPCGLHVAQIVLMNFENTAFGKLDSPSGLSLKKHPYNLINLAFHLHDGYNESDKDNPLNMKAEVIRALYKELLNYNLTKYQKPIRTRWLCELQTAKQYFERYSAHLQFTQWFIQKLDTIKKVPQKYCEKWKIFYSWLNDAKLNLQLRCIVKFGEKFFEPIYEFLTGYDPVPRIYNQNGIAVTLPPGNRAHEMPDKVMIWIDELQDAAKNIPLSVCRLGGDYGQEFARAFLYVFFSKQLSNVSWRESSYIKVLEEDLQNKNINTFGLMEALQEPNFLKEFKEFSDSDSNEYWKFPLIYTFIKCRIWPIVIHQQQLEGMFNKYDIKVHANMSNELQESRIVLSGPGNEGAEITKEKLEKIRQKLREKEKTENINEKLTSREDAADFILNSFLLR